MAGVETRSKTRESLFMFAEIELDGQPDARRIRVRNLSDIGMMGEGRMRVLRGSRLIITFRGMPAVIGHVAWVEGERFGIAFDEEFDCEMAKRLSAHSVTQSAHDSDDARRWNTERPKGDQRPV